MGDWATLAGRLLPLGARERLRNSSWWQGRRRRQAALHLARGSKRLDLVAGQVARVLHLCGRPALQGRDVLELGAGWVLSHALVFHLLGARRIVASDLHRLAVLPALSEAVGGAEPSAVFEQLSPFTDHEGLRKRLATVFGLPRFTSKALDRMGISYEAPLDLLRTQDSDLGRFDLIYSNSVLEHVPAEDCRRLAERLLAHLADEGLMIHAIHLEDHSDFQARPFEFLRYEASEHDRAAQAIRGNRIRAARWLEILEAAGEARVEVRYRSLRAASLLPPEIDASVMGRDEDDLRTSHLLVEVRPAGAGRAGA